MRTWIEKNLFKWEPTSWKRSTYNSVIGLVGCALLADSLRHFVGMALILEAALVTIEGCWTPDADDGED